MERRKPSPKSSETQRKTKPSKMEVYRPDPELVRAAFKEMNRAFAQDRERIGNHNHIILPDDYLVD